MTRSLYAALTRTCWNQLPLPVGLERSPGWYCDHAGGRRGCFLHALGLLEASSPHCQSSLAGSATSGITPLILKSMLKVS